MQHTRSVFLDRRNVLGGAVSFVFLKSVLRKRGSLLRHPSISCHFCDDGCGCYRRFRVVAADDGGMGIIEPKLVASVYEQICRGDFFGQHRESFLHRAVGRFQNAVFVDLLFRTFADAPYAVRPDPLVGALSLCLRERLAIADDAVVFSCACVRGPCPKLSASAEKQEGNMACGSDNRSGQRPSSCFINACYDDI